MSGIEKVLLWTAVAFLGLSFWSGISYLGIYNPLGAIHSALIALCLIQFAIAIR